MKNKIFTFLALVLLSSCGSIEVENHEWCVDLGTDGATCFYTLTEDKRRLEKPEWDELRKGWLAGSTEAFGNLQEVIKQLCEQTKKCTYEMEKKINKFFEKVEEAKKELKPKPHDGFPPGPVPLLTPYFYESDGFEF